MCLKITSSLIPTLQKITLKVNRVPFKDPEKRKAYQKKYQSKYYQRNREEVIARSVTNKKKLRKAKRAWLLEQLGGKCISCGYEGANLHCHHTDKSYKRPWGDVRGGTQGGSGIRFQRGITDYPWEDLKKKIHTLELLCGNCHMEHHAEERENE